MLEDGHEVEVRNDHGRVRVRLLVSTDVLPGVAVLPGKWWAQDVGAAGINTLIPPSSSPGGQPAYNDSFVTVVVATA